MPLESSQFSAKFLGLYLASKKSATQVLKSPIAPGMSNSAIELNNAGVFGAVRTNLQISNSSYKSENDLINKYRDAATTPLIDTAIEQIMAEAIVNDEPEKPPVSLKLIDGSPVPAAIVKILASEFDNILNILEFKHNGHDIFRRWYVDGRVIFHKVIDENDPAQGIQQLRYIDPRKIKMVRERVMSTANQATPFFPDLNTRYNEYWIYSDDGIDASASTLSGLPTNQNYVKFARDAIAFSTSGLWDPSGKMVISHLHKALRSLNQYRQLQDAVVIYRLIRASDKRKFLIDVGNLPHAKAEQAMREIMQKFKNDLSYNSSTGEINEDRRFVALTEDYWFAVRDGQQHTDVQNIQGGGQLGNIDDVELLKQELMRALNVPVGRLDPQASPIVDFSGAGTQISREELMFARFISMIRTRFTMLFQDLLKTQCVLKNIMSADEFDEIKSFFIFDFARDTFFAELKELEIIGLKSNTIAQMGSLIGTFFSKEWVYKNVLGMDDAQIQEIQEQIENDMLADAQRQVKMGAILGPQQPPADGQEEQPAGAPQGMDVPMNEEIKKALQKIKTLKG